MKTCYVFVGLPGLGKSTLINKLFDVEDYHIYSTDNYIERIASEQNTTYSEVFLNEIKNATKYADENLNTAVLDEQDVIWDQTNLSVKKRKAIIDKMRAAGYEVQAIYIQEPDKTQLDDIKEWANRLKYRPGKVIPTEIMIKMVNSLEKVTSDESFDKITVYNMYGEHIISAK